jgi:hypothetical protein
MSDLQFANIKVPVTGKHSTFISTFLSGMNLEGISELKFWKNVNDEENWGFQIIQSRKWYHKSDELKPSTGNSLKSISGNDVAEIKTVMEDVTAEGPIVSVEDKQQLLRKTIRKTNGATVRNDNADVVGLAKGGERCTKGKAVVRKVDPLH